MKTTDINFHSYDDVELLMNFQSTKQLERYRNERKNNYDDVVSLLRSYMKDKVLRVVEIGSGSSACLYNLEEQDMIEDAVGIELSKSRYEFAEKWREDLDSKRIKNIHTNFIDVKLKTNYYDIVLCIDNTFSYLQPENKNYPLNLIEKAHQWLNAGGVFIIQIHNYSKLLKTMQNNLLTFWEKNKKSNSFNYSLYSYKYNEKKNHLTTTSYYISNKLDEKKKEVISFVYTVDDIRSLTFNRFNIVNVFSDNKKNEFSEDSDDIVIICSKII